MYDARGNAVESKASARDTVLTVDVPDTLAEGTYVVSWRVVSADGHPVAGALTFSVGQPSSRRTATTEARRVVPARGARRAECRPGTSATWDCSWPPGSWCSPRGCSRRCRGWTCCAAGCDASCVSRPRWRCWPVLVQLPLSGAYQQGLGFSDLLGGSVWSGAGGRELLGLVLLTGRPRARRRPARHHTVARSRAGGRHRGNGAGHRVAVRGRPLEGLPATAAGGRHRRPARRCRSGLARWPGRSGAQPARARRPVPRGCGDARPLLGSRRRRS